MVSPVVAGLNDSVPVSRRMIRRAVGLAVAGWVLVIAGLAAWVLGAAGGVVPQSAADITQLAGVGLVAAGAVCGLVMIVTLLAAGRVPRAVDTPPAVGESDEAAELEGPAGLAPAAPPLAGSPAPEPLSEQVPLAERLPSRPGAEPAPPWSPGPAAGSGPAPAPAWSPEPTAEPVPQWSPGPAGPEAPPQPVPPWPPGTPPERVPEPAPDWAHEPAEEGVPEPGTEWAHQPAAEPAPQPAPDWAHEPAAEPLPGATPEWADEPAAEWVPGPASVPTADQSAGAPVTGLEAGPDEQPAEPDRARRASRKPAVGWNPDSAEDWLRVLRGLRVSEQTEADGHLSRED
jgi:hypothetical protein